MTISSRPNLRLTVDEATGRARFAVNELTLTEASTADCGNGVFVSFDVADPDVVRCVEIENPSDFLSVFTVGLLLGDYAAEVLSSRVSGAEVPSGVASPALTATQELAEFLWSSAASPLRPSADAFTIEYAVRFDALAQAGLPVDDIVGKALLSHLISSLRSSLSKAAGVSPVVDAAVNVVARYAGEDAIDVIALEAMVKSARERSTPKGDAAFWEEGLTIAGNFVFGNLNVKRDRELVFAAASDDERVDTLEVHLGHYSPFFGFGEGDIRTRRDGDVVPRVPALLGLEGDIRTRRDGDVVRVWLPVQPGVLLPESPETAAPYHAHMTQWSVVIFDANDRSVLASGPGMLFQDPLGLLTPDECKGNLIAVLELPETTSLRDVYVAVRPSDDIGVGETPDERALAVGRRWAWRAAWYRQLHATEVREQPHYKAKMLLAKDAYLKAASSFEQAADTWFHPRGKKDLEGEARRLAALCRGYAGSIAAD